ncbi:MAG TPA: OmpH family outer membrane protein, partial [Pyrinomonadaceae bacterium]|nr:OmpH family outer membrane protein [Pyrinomonadaceae bacterium]
ADEKQGIVRIVTAMKRVESEFQPRRTELQQLQQKVNQLTEDINKTMTIAAPQEIQRKQDTLDQAKKDAQRKGEDAQTAYNKRMQEVMGPVYEDLGKALDTFAKARGVTLLLDVSKIGPAILNTPPEAMDVTRAFITEFNTKFPATASVTPPQ